MVLRGAIFIQEVCIATIFLFVLQMSLAKSLGSLEIVSLTDSADQEKKCFNFSLGNREKKEFFSPNYPNNYPNNTKCTLQISAPFNHVVQLDFRDQFHLEDSPECKDDKLEVRDGPYGNSVLIDTFCGHTFPRIITSSDRYLWLQFTSDESIEYSGFRAVYEFKKLNGNPKPEIHECLYHRFGPAGIIRKADIEESRYIYSKNYSVPIDCTWSITAQTGWKIYMNFLNFKLESPNDCDLNFMEIYSDTRSTASLIVHFCGTTAEPQKSPTNIAHIRLFTDTKAYNNTNFEIHYTAYRELEKEEKCHPGTEFNCGDQTCINKSLKCDGQFDCKYLYDEDPKLCDKVPLAGMVLTSKHMIIILVVFFALVIAMCASISISCYNKIKERQSAEETYKQRRSKEASVEGNVDRSVAGSPDRALEAALANQAAKIGAQRNTTSQLLDYDDDSDDGCYVPEIDLNVFRKYPNGGGNISRATESRSPSRGIPQPEIRKQHHPLTSDRRDSIQSETIVAPPPPPLPLHLKDRRDINQPPPYRDVAGRIAMGPEKSHGERRVEPSAKPDMDRIAKAPETLPQQRSFGRWPPENRTGQAKGLSDIRPVGGGLPRGAADIEGVRPAPPRGPLEAGVSRAGFFRSPPEVGMSRSPMTRGNIDSPRGPLARSSERGPAPAKSIQNYSDSPYVRDPRANTYRNFKNSPNPDEGELEAPHQFRAQAVIESSDLPRPGSVESSQSAPDVIAQH